MDVATELGIASFGACKYEGSQVPVTSLLSMPALLADSSGQLLLAMGWASPAICLASCRVETCLLGSVCRQLHALHIAACKLTHRKLLLARNQVHLHALLAWDDWQLCVSLMRDWL